MHIFQIDLTNPMELSIETIYNLTIERNYFN
jgi:hypothetical protein